MGKRVLHYFSTMRGFTNLEGGKGIVYYGVVCRIPRSEVDKIAGRGESIGTLTKQYEPLPEELAQDITYPDGSQAEVVPNGIFERYEAYDRETGDYLVMWRIPYRTKGKSRSHPPGDTVKHRAERRARRSLAR